MNIKGEKDRVEGTFGHFSRLGCTFTDFFECLAWIFFSAFRGRGKK